MANKLPMVAPLYLPGKEPLPPGITEEDREQLKQALKYQQYVVSAMESCAGKAVISGVIGFGLGAFFSLMSASLAIDDPMRQTMIDRVAYEKAKRLENEAKGAGGSGATTAGRAAPARGYAAAPLPLAAAAPPSAMPHSAGPSSGSILSKLPRGEYFKNLPPPPPPLPATSMQSTKEFFIQTGRSMYSSGRGFGKVGALYSGIECCIESFRAKNDIVNPVVGGFLAGGILARNTGPQTAFGSAIAFAAFSGAIDLFLRRETSDED
ncbi:Mitochondrial import inner membrane translocase subunit tim22 [Malassezia caprae]|uniref:Mitochondrial import inner membrane translocase subunit TIM22 n=1 Tax=Malassezia caprae TaxID=1381934 RepID=A0AAF0E834_9BASI|nr:Mitochondrial import inner membrane translocase subunit tim22 [Malassezia caprae]